MPTVKRTPGGMKVHPKRRRVASRLWACVALILFLCRLAADAQEIGGVKASTTSQNGVRKADMFGGANAGTRITAAIVDLSATGGTVDARGLDGTQTISSDIGFGVTKPVTLVMGAGTYSVTADVILPANITLQMGFGSEFSVVSGKTLAIKGCLEITTSQHFGGSGNVSLTANQCLNGVQPEWWGAVADNSTDSSAAIAKAVAVHKPVRFFTGKYLTDPIIGLGLGDELMGAGKMSSILESRTGGDIIAITANVALSRLKIHDPNSSS